LSYIGNKPYITRRKEMKTATQRIWSDLNGRCECDKHIGVEASAILEARPKAKTLTTSMTKWSIMTEEDVAYLSNEYCNGGTICESCRY
jgi:hypothetical protein